MPLRLSRRTQGHRVSTGTYSAPRSRRFDQERATVSLARQPLGLGIRFGPTQSAHGALTFLDDVGCFYEISIQGAFGAVKRIVLNVHKTRIKPAEMLVNSWVPVGYLC